MATGLIKYNGFQISRNKQNETPYSIVKKKLWSINYIRTTSLKPVFVNFNICGSSECEKHCTFYWNNYALVYSKNIFRLLAKRVKTICNPKWSQVIHNAQILEKQDEYNRYIIIKTMSHPGCHHNTTTRPSYKNKPILTNV